MDEQLRALHRAILADPENEQLKEQLMHFQLRAQLIPADAQALVKRAILAYQLGIAPPPISKTVPDNAADCGSADKEREERTCLISLPITTLR